MKSNTLFAFLLVCNVIAFSLAEQSDTEAQPKCTPSPTTVTGTRRPAEICSGALIFEDNFDEFDITTWEHENTLGGGGNWEFQWYTNNRTNSYVEDGIFYIRPTLTSDEFGEGFLTSGTLNLHGGTPHEYCTNPAFYGCERGGGPNNVLNPIKSARVRTINSFSFKYGRVEINARLPAGDWLWPALWFMPTRNVYGTWPASGEIDLMESRGNREFYQNGVNIGTEQVGSTLHFGPNGYFNAWPAAHASRNSAPGNGFHLGFHRYQMEWTPDYIRFSIDDVETNFIPSGFWQRGAFEQNVPGVENPWRFHSDMAPFDQEFYLIMNLACGGIAYFTDDGQNPGGKPWANNSPQASTDFWNGRNQWLHTWNLDINHSKEASLQVDYVRIWAL